jgi:hypothetical protein
MEKTRGPRPPFLTARQERAARYRSQWAEARKEALQRRLAENRPPKDRKPRPIRAAEIVRALELFYAATCDPAFESALATVYRHGFDVEPQRTAARMLLDDFGDYRDDYLVQVDFLVGRGLLDPSGRRRKLSVREACEAVAAGAGIPGTSFVAVVEDLRRRWQRRLAQRGGQKKTQT